MKKILTITMMLIGVLSLFSSCKKDDASKPIYQNKWIYVGESGEGEGRFSTGYIELGKNGKGTFGYLLDDESFIKMLKTMAADPESDITEEQKKAINKLKLNDVLGSDITYTIISEDEGKTGTLTIVILAMTDSEGNQESVTMKYSIESKDLMIIYLEDGSTQVMRSASSLNISVGKMYAELTSLFFN